MEESTSVEVIKTTRRGRKRKDDGPTDSRLCPPPPPPDPRINQMLAIFYRINPLLEFSGPQRRASEKLLKAYDDKAIKLAEYAVSIQGNEYAPVIHSPLELVSKASKLIQYYHRNNSVVGKIVIKPSYDV